MVLVELLYRIEYGGNTKVSSLNYLVFPNGVEAVLKYAPSGFIEWTWSDVSGTEAEQLKMSRMIEPFVGWLVNRSNSDIVKYFKLIENEKRANKDLFKEIT
jgi:hypothetical protein